MNQSTLEFALACLLLRLCYTLNLETVVETEILSQGRARLPCERLFALQSGAPSGLPPCVPAAFFAIFETTLEIC